MDRVDRDGPGRMIQKIPAERGVHVVFALEIPRLRLCNASKNFADEAA
jgi:hypothetical protein